MLELLGAESCEGAPALSGPWLDFVVPALSDPAFVFVEPVLSEPALVFVAPVSVTDFSDVRADAIDGRPSVVGLAPVVLSVTVRRVVLEVTGLSVGESVV